MRLNQTLQFDGCLAAREVFPLLFCEEQSSSTGTEPLGRGGRIEDCRQLLGGNREFTVIQNGVGGKG